MTEELIRAEAKHDQYAKTMSMIGFDYFGAMLLATEIDRIDRFDTPKQLVSWSGMCPTVHQSGDSLYHGKMKKDSNRKVNWMLTQAANSAIRADGRMKKYYQRIHKKHPHSVAVTHVANKMITIIWHMLTNDKPYDVKPKLYAQKINCA